MSQKLTVLLKIDRIADGHLLPKGLITSGPIRGTVNIPSMPSIVGWDQATEAGANPRFLYDWAWRIFARAITRHAVLLIVMCQKCICRTGYLQKYSTGCWIREDATTWDDLDSVIIHDGISRWSSWFARRNAHTSPAIMTFPDVGISPALCQHSKFAAWIRLIVPLLFKIISYLK